MNQNPDGTQRHLDRSGLARELARMNLSLNYYTQWYWKVDLHNLLNFISLRANADAQHEIRVYAKAILEQFLRPWCPLTYEAFCDYRLNARTLSANAIAVVRALVARQAEQAYALRQSSGIAPREWRELMETLGLE